MARFGSLGTQYFDGAGDPLVDGKIYFFASGSNTPKTTFADVNETIANTNPVILTADGRQPNVFFSGSARAILTKSDDTQVEVRDPVGGAITADAFGDWNALLIYDFNDIVQGPDGKFYISIINNNVGNDPENTNGFWMEVNFIATYDAGYPYAKDNVCIATDQQLYLSLIENNLGNEPSVSATEWKILTFNPATIGVMLWEDAWNPIDSYAQNDVVRDGSWTMVANKATSDRPAPQPSAPAETTLPDTPLWAINSNVSVVWSGQLYDFTQAGWVDGLRVWAPELTADTNYRIIISDVTDPANPVAEIIEGTVLNENAWTIVALSQSIVNVGTKLLVYLDALNSGGDTQVTGGWRYDGEQNTLPPNDEGWNRRTQNDIVRIDKTDLNSTDRSAELLGIIVDSNIQFVETATPTNLRLYRVTSPPVDQGLYVEYGVVLLDTNGDGIPTPGTVCTMTADIPIVQATEYVELASNWPGNNPSWATVTGFLAFDGVDQAVTTSAFGTDISFTQAYVSPDWDLLAFSGGSSGGGDTSLTSNPSVLINGDMSIWQRGTAFTGVAADSFSADRWGYEGTGTGIDINRVSDDSSAAAFAMELVAVVGNTDATIRQRMEAANSTPLTGKSLTLTLRIKTVVAETFQIELVHADAFEDFTTTTLIQNSGNITTVGGGAWETISFSFAAMPSGVSNGLEARLEFGAMAVATEDITFTNVKLERGSTSTEFFYIPPSEVLRNCMSYFERVDSALANGTLNYFAISQCTSTSGVAVGLLYSDKRAIPTLSFSAVTDFAIVNNAGVPVQCLTITPTIESVKSAFFQATVAGTPLIAGDAGLFIADSNNNAFIDIDAEL